MGLTYTNDTYKIHNQHGCTLPRMGTNQSVIIYMWKSQIWIDTCMDTSEQDSVLLEETQHWGQIYSNKKYKLF